MRNAVFVKTMQIIRRNINIKLVTVKERGNHLVSKLNYHTTKWFSENVSPKEIENTELFINKSIY